MVITFEMCDEESIGEIIDLMAQSNDEKIRGEAARLEQKHFGVEPHLQEMST